MKFRRLNLFYRLCRDTISESMSSNVPRLGAALAYYSLFAIAPLFVIALAMGGFWFGEDAARRELFGQLSGLIGREGGEAVQTLVAAANKPKAGTLATIIALITLFIGATGVFVELQDALNSVWNVRTPSGRGFRHFIRNRLLSFAMVVGMGFLLLVSLVLSSVLAAFGKFMDGLVSGQHLFWMSTNFLFSLAVITLLFALMFKVLPDADIAWRDVWLGALVTALLFNIGKFAIGFYLGRSSVASAYGAAGSIVILLVWVYYSAQILFFGAKFTQIYANNCGSHIKPARNTQAHEKKHTASRR